MIGEERIEGRLLLAYRDGLGTLLYHCLGVGIGLGGGHQGPCGELPVIPRVGEIVNEKAAYGAATK